MKELKRKLSGQVLHFEVSEVKRNQDWIIVSYRVPQEYQENRSGLHVPAGTISYGFFWKERPFNVYYFAGEEDWIAAYFNVCAVPTQITEDEIDWLDLEVDLVVFPDGRTVVLDEEEVPHDISEQHRLQLKRAKEWILQESGKPLLQEMDLMLHGF